MGERVSSLLTDVAIPKFVRVRQKFERPVIPTAQLKEAVLSQMSEDRLYNCIKSGQSVCITVGSRGIAHIDIITRAIVDYCKQRGANPFIIPAMGSHGGAKAESQRELLASLNVTEESMGCPIRATMETVVVGKSPLGHDVHIDAYAAKADAIIVNCRVRPHPSFRGPYESGIMKMMTIGMGKQVGAQCCHEAGMQYMAQLIPMFGKVILENAPVAMAVACVENPYNEICKVEAMLPQEIETREPELLKYAFTMMPRIMFDKCDVLIVDQIGKNICGDGMDPNITGTFCTPYASGGIKAQRVGLLRLTEESHGNAQGIGNSDAISQKLFEKVDMEQSLPTAITSTVLKTVMIPPVMKNDRETIQLCIKVCNEIDKTAPQIVRIKDTSHLEEIMISEGLITLARQNPLLELLGPAEELDFDAEGNIKGV